MSSINRIVMAGRLARDPELKEIRDGLKACRLVIATEHKQKTKDGVENKEVCFMDCTVWNKTAEHCAKLKKGSAIVVEGRVKQEKWIDKTNNSERTRHVIACDNITFLDRMPNLTGETSIQPAVRPIPKAAPVIESMGDYEELPF